MANAAAQMARERSCGLPGVLGGRVSSDVQHKLRFNKAAIKCQCQESPKSKRHGIPHGMVSHTAWYRTRHSIHMRCHAAAHVPSSAEHGSRRPFFALRSQPSPGADVVGARSVPVQMWHSRAGLPSRYDVAVAAPRQRHKCSLSRSLRYVDRLAADVACCTLHAAPLHSIEMPFGRTST